MKKCFGAFVGRFCPVYLGHESIIKKMIKACGIDNCLIILGSANASIADSLRKTFARKWEQCKKM